MTSREKTILSLSKECSFLPVAGKAYEIALAKGFGREILSEWFLQNIRD